MVPSTHSGSSWPTGSGLPCRGGWYPWDLFEIETLSLVASVPIDLVRSSSSRCLSGGRPRRWRGLSFVGLPTLAILTAFGWLHWGRGEPCFLYGPEDAATRSFQIAQLAPPIALSENPLQRPRYLTSATSIGIGSAEYSLNSIQAPDPASMALPGNAVPPFVPAGAFRRPDAETTSYSFSSIPPPPPPPAVVSVWQKLGQLFTSLDSRIRDVPLGTNPIPLLSVVSLNWNAHLWYRTNFHVRFPSEFDFSTTLIYPLVTSNRSGIHVAQTSLIRLLASNGLSAHRDGPDTITIVPRVRVTTDARQSVVRRRGHWFVKPAASEWLLPQSRGTELGHFGNVGAASAYKETSGPKVRCAKTKLPGPGGRCFAPGVRQIPSPEGK